MINKFVTDSIPIKIPANAGPRTRMVGKTRPKCVVATLLLFVIPPQLDAGSSKNLPITTAHRVVALDHSTNAAPVGITYLGAGGVVIERAGHAIMGAPFFSNPVLLRVALPFPISPRPERIERGFRPVPNLRAILVGHAHYDHLMDLPYLYRKHGLTAEIFGSATTKNILAAVHDDIPPALVTDVGIRNGRPHTVGNMDIIAIPSDHAPHFFCLKLFGGKATGPKPKLPRTAWGWKEGQTYAFLLTIKDPAVPDSSIRIFYQDAASAVPAEFFQSPPYENLRVDIAILCVPGFNYISGYPEDIIHALQPRHVILIHWEDFFRRLPSKAKNLRSVPLTNVNRFIYRMLTKLPADAGWTLPAPSATIHFDLLPLP